MCDNMHRVGPTRGAHQSLGVQGFHWASVMQTGLTVRVAELGLSPSEGQADNTWPKDPTIHHIVTQTI